VRPADDRGVTPLVLGLDVLNVIHLDEIASSASEAIEETAILRAVGDASLFVSVAPTDTATDRSSDPSGHR